MTDRIPSGTRDVLPDEMRELRAITERVRAVFESSGYGEVYTPALEYEGTLERGELSGARPAYRMFDEHGNVLVLRSDMTVPIARLVSNRYRRPSRRCASATSPTPTVACVHSAVSRGSSCRRGSSSSAHRRRRGRPRR